MKTNETQPKWVKADIDGNGERWLLCFERDGGLVAPTNKADFGGKSCTCPCGETLTECKYCGHDFNPDADYFTCPHNRKKVRNET